MEKIKQHFHLIIIVLIVLLIAPVVYYFAYALPKYNVDKLDLDKQKYLDEQVKIMSEEQKKEQQKNLLDSCLGDADFSYFNSWDNQCKAWKMQVDTEWENCRDSLYSWETDEENKSRCKVSTSDYQLDENGTCLLPSARSSSVEEDVKNLKDECYRKYPVLY